MVIATHIVSMTTAIDVHELIAKPRCAGICELVKDEHGKYRRIRLKLSEALLKYRPRSDTINTLLHEAIHAYFFVTTSWRHSRGDDGTGHGAGFLLLADAINDHGGYEVTVFHTFHDEVESYRTHIWLCDGPCQQQAPFFGLVKRSMNRAPGKSDSWWAKHLEECGGTYSKIAEPEVTKAQISAMTAKERAGRQKNKIDSYVVKPQANEPSFPEARPFGPDDSVMPDPRKRCAEPLQDDATESHKRPALACPICDLAVTEATVNEHLDREHG